uniref:BESS domain-containing protein n=1 Tax=Trichogramma kaykai TaxID=54128 RepID=A0ABD2X501_9HYME
MDFTLNGDSNSSLDATNASTNEKSPIEIKKRKQECNMELYRELLNILKQQVISQPKELDVIGAFAKLVEECLRKLPYRKQKQLQRTIYNAMSKAEDECFEE